MGMRYRMQIKSVIKDKDRVIAWEGSLKFH